MRPFFHTLTPPPPSPASLEVGLASLLCEKVKHYPVLYDKQIKGCREKDIVSNAWNAEAKNLEFTENGKNKFILFFMLYLR